MTPHDKASRQRFEKFKNEKLPKAGAVIHVIAYEAWQACEASQPDWQKIRAVLEKIGRPLTPPGKTEDDKANIHEITDMLTERVAIARIALTAIREEVERIENNKDMIYTQTVKKTISPLGTEQFDVTLTPIEPPPAHPTSTVRHRLSSAWSRLGTRPARGEAAGVAVPMVDPRLLVTPQDGVHDLGDPRGAGCGVA